MYEGNTCIVNILDSSKKKKNHPKILHKKFFLLHIRIIYILYHTEFKTKKTVV